MSRIRPTRTEHGASGCLVITSDETCVRVIYTQPAFAGEPASTRQWFILAYSPEIARDTAKALRAILTAEYSPLHLLSILPSMDFVGPREVSR